jgi:CRP-like cAMP-binding protein
MKTLDEVIAEHPFFADLPDEYRKLVAGCGQMAAYKAGEFLFKTGGEAEHFFLVRHGKLALELQAPGKPEFRFETVGEGEVVGWSWLFEPHKWQFDARAVDDVSVVKFDGKCLRGKCDADPKLGYDIMKRFSRVLVQRFADTRLQLIDVYGKQGS